ncbi:MAG: OmpH family outer membrane protein [Kangiellaceae bacterium]|nr:OmpH family outer membrane protein [Kangiellaceae bacterium]
MKNKLQWLVFLALFLPISVFANSKIGVIDTVYILAKAPQKEATSNRLKNEFSGRESELKRLGETIEKERTSYINNVATMSESQATTKKRDLQKKVSDFQLKQKAFQEDVARRSREEQQKLGKVVKQAVDAVAKRGGYNMLIDRQAAPYIDATVPDLTQQVMAELAK